MINLGKIQNIISKFTKESKFKVDESLHFDYRYESKDAGGITILADNLESNPVKPDDDFSFSEYSNTIVKMINGSKQKFSVGIYGDWGTGKTTLMKMIEKGLKPEVFTWGNVKSHDSLNKFLHDHFSQFNLSWIDENVWHRIDDRTMKISDTSNSTSSREVSIKLDFKNNTAILLIDSTPVYEFLLEEIKENGNDFVLRENHILTIWFEAWRFEREKDFATVALMKTIAYGMGRHRIFNEIKKIILKGLAIITKDVLRNLAVTYAMTPEGVAELEKNFTQKMENLAAFDKETIYFEGIKSIELKMSEILKKYPHSRVVVFIDDLDRCSDETALEVFESVKVFLDIQGFVFIIGLSRTVMDKLIKYKFKDLNINPEDYFRKIVQVEVRIPKWQSSGIKNVLNELILRLDENSRHKITGEDENQNLELIEMAANAETAMNLNPRSAKNLISRLLLLLSSNPGLKSQRILVNEVIYTRWKEIHEYLSDTEFKDRFKEFLKMDDLSKRHEIDEARKRAEAQDYKPDIFTLFLNQAGSDRTLYKFLNDFSTTILDIENETGEGKGWERLQYLTDTSTIPISPSFNEDRINFYRKLLRYLSRSEEIVREHLEKRNRLDNLLKKNGRKFQKSETYSEGIERLHTEMNTDEIYAFNELKNTTKDMFTYNSLIFELLKDNPSFLKELNVLQTLYDHYEVWFKKYKEKMNRNNVAVIYVGTTERKPFPRNAFTIIQDRIRELELQTSYQDAIPTK